MARFRPALWPTVFTIPVLAVALALGWWQLERRDWKHALMSTLDQRLAQTPMTLDEALAAPDEREFRRIRVSGTFLHDHELHFPGRTLDGRVGFEIITPLALGDQRGHVLIDRGWVPQEGIAPAMRPASQPSGTVSVEGVLRGPPDKGWFRPDNAPRQNQWFSVDPVAAALYAGVDPAGMLPFYIVAVPDEGRLAAGDRDLPIPRNPRIQLPDNHLQYAITWFSLAGVLLAIYVLYHLRRDKEA